MSEFIGKSGEEVLVQEPTPVVRVNERFYNLEPNPFTGNDFDDYEMFLKHGFQLRIGNDPNLSNALEVSLTAGEDAFECKTAENALAVAASGIPLPRRFDVSEVLAISEPIVAKDITANRGRNKYLLETDEQKIRYIAGLLRYATRPNAPILYEDLIRMVDSGNVGWDAIRQDPRNRFIQEEFVDTPGDHFTSFRIVADAFGQLHYGLVLRSKERKDETKIFIDHQYETGLLPGLPAPGPFDVNVNDAFEGYDESPLHIGTRKFNSNTATGGIAINLNQTPAEGLDRQVLVDLGIDPNLPEIPQALAEGTKNIGRAFRGVYPYVGADYVRTKDGRFLLLEVNVPPGLNVKALGLTLEPYEDPKWQFYERVIAGAKALYPQAFQTRPPRTL